MRPRLVSLLQNTIRVLGNIISLAIISGLIIGFVWFGRTGYQYWFVSKVDPFSIKLTKYSSINANIPRSCDSLTKDFQPVEILISRSKNAMYKTDMVLEAKDVLEFNIHFPDGEITAQEYFPDSTKRNIKTEEINRTVKGFAQKITLEYTDLDYFAMHQYFCKPKFDIVDFAFFSLLTDSVKAAGISQYLPQGAAVKLSVYSPTKIGETTFDGVSRIDYIFKSNNDYFPLELFSKSDELQVTFPAVNNSMSSGSFEAISVFADELQIERPEGTLKFGNDVLIDLVQVASTSDDMLIIPRTEVNGYGETYLIIWDKARGTQISGKTRSLLLNNEDLGKAPWYGLPDYVQAGLFGLLISLLGGIWAYRNPLIKRILTFVPFWNLIDPSIPPKGSYVCVMNSGIVVAGELSRKPGRNYSYYIIKNARRKLNPSSEWEKEIIPEIKIRADSVEQSYVL